MTGAAVDDVLGERTTLVVVPAFGQPTLTDAVLCDLLDPGTRSSGPHRVVVVDNMGDYELPRSDPSLSLHRPGGNLRWIGSVNWGLAAAAAHGDAVCTVLNNDTRLSAGLIDRLAVAFTDCDDVAVAAPCYDDFWRHQRARTLPATAAGFVGADAYRQVPFCDGTAIAFSVAAAQQLGPLDSRAFPRHGYGADIDFALRAGEVGMRCVVTESAFVSHLRRGTMDRLPAETSERNRAEILRGLDGLWGDRWRKLAGLGAGAFPAHNTGSSASWYAG